MKKILYIGGFCMPDGNAAAQRVLGMAKLMRECGCEVRFSGLTRKIKNGSENGEIDGFTFVNHAYPASAIKWLKYLTGRDSAIADIKDYNPDIVVLYNHPALAIEHIASFCKHHDIKVLADVTEWYEADGNPVFRVIKGYDSNRRMHKSHLKLDGLICISSFLSDFYNGKGVRTIEIPPLVDVKQEKWHQAKDPDSEEIRIIYAGSPGSAKDRLDIIIAALDKIIPTLNSRVRFDVIGLSAEQYAAKYNDNGQREYVVFNGRKPHMEVIHKLINADFQIFIRPDNLTNRAGFPTKFVETVTSRTLPITNLSSNLGQYLKDGINGFAIKGLDNESIIDSVSVPLKMSRNQINAMKQNINSDLFDYRNYVASFQQFINSI